MSNLTDPQNFMALFDWAYSHTTLVHQASHVSGRLCTLPLVTRWATGPSILREAASGDAGVPFCYEYGWTLPELIIQSLGLMEIAMSVFIQIREMDQETILARVGRSRRGRDRPRLGALAPRDKFPKADGGAVDALERLPHILAAVQGEVSPKM